MLSQTSINSAFPLAALVSRQGVALGVKPQSALADLLDARDSQPFDDGEVQSPAQRVLADSTATDENGDCDHCTELDRLADLGARAAAFTMDVARNQVTPKVKEVVAATEAYIDAVRNKKLSPLLVQPKFQASIYDSADLRGLLSKYEKAPNRDVTPVQLAAQWDNAATVGPLCTGITSFDADLSRHFEGREGEAQALWQKYFSNVPGQYRSANWREDLRNPDDALVIFLGANTLAASDDVAEGTSVDLPAYRAYLESIKEQAGSHLTYLLDRDQSAMNARRLVANAPQASRPGDPLSGVISVYGPTYNQWLQDGGSPEALCGAVLHGASLDYDALLTNASTHSAAWGRHLNVLNAQLAFELRAATIQGLKLALLDTGKSIPEDERRIDGETLLSEVQTRLTKLTNEDLENLYAIAENEVCALFYPHTDAKNFLSAMGAKAESMPGVDMREVAGACLADYVAGWVASAIVATKAE
jgi:hypothetical protein